MVQVYSTRQEYDMWKGALYGPPTNGPSVCGFYSDLEILDQDLKMNFKKFGG